MAREPVVYGVSLAVVVVGLVVLVAGEAVGPRSLVWGGGGVFLLSVSVMAGVIARP
jgi:hypothetical protein